MTDSSVSPWSEPADLIFEACEDGAAVGRHVGRTFDAIEAGIEVVLADLKREYKEWGARRMRHRIDELIAELEKSAQRRDAIEALNERDRREGR
jgi:hypothetical protein